MATAAFSHSPKKSNISVDNRNLITSADVLKLKKPAVGFLCPLTLPNPVQFVEFNIRDPQSDNVFFDIKRPIESLEWTHDTLFQPSDELRTIEYSFPKEMLFSDTITTNLVFAVNPETGLENFRMIEIHYFKDKLIKSFDFTFGFCIPGSVNTWENSYKLPKLSTRTIRDMVNSPNQTVSDSYYFVNDKLVMHNKAVYSYY